MTGLQGHQLGRQVTVEYPSPTAVLADGVDGQPARSVLEGAFPNPFNSQVLIRFGVAVDSRVTLQVYNAMGQRVRTLVDERLRPGYHLRQWDGRNDAGDALGSGVYVCRLTAGDLNQSRRVMLLK